MLRASISRLRRRAELVARLGSLWLHRPATPTRLVLDVTRRCNLRCAMCRTWEREPGHELGPDEVHALLAQMEDLLWLDVTGGEPFLRADAEQLFARIVEATPRLRVLHFQTNGWFERRVVEVSRRIVESRRDLDLIVTVSLDGPPEVHDRVRGRPGSFERALATFLALRELPGVEVYVGTTVTPFNADRIEDLGAVLRARVPGFRDAEWHWNWMQISEHFFGNGHLAPRRSEASSDLVRRHLRRRGVPRSLVELMELLFLVNLEFYRRGEPSGVVCQALHSAAFVSPEGQLFPCHVWDRPLGDLRSQPVAALWGSAQVRAARAEAEALACGGCFTPCEAYPALAGAPLQALRATGRRALRVLHESARS